MSVRRTLKDYRKIIEMLLIPNAWYRGVEEIPMEALYHRGFNTIFLDVDNTLLPYEQRELTLQKLTWITRLKESGYRVFFLSNNLSKRRIERLCRQAGLSGVHFACKPFAASLRELARDCSVQLDKSLIVGDQLLKDVALAKWVGAYGILVDPLSVKGSVLKSFQRDLEFKILRWLGVAKAH